MTHQLLVSTLIGLSLMDIAPTVLEATDIERPDHMLAKSFMDVLKSDQSGVIDTTRDHVIIGRERHVGEARRDRAPYPSRAIRTSDFLLIRNFKPDRMPMGEVFQSEATAEQLLQDHYLAYPDMDASPTKVFLMTNRDAYPKHFDFAFSVRPEFELYDLKSDPDQVKNVAADPDYSMVLRNLTDRMMNELRDLARKYPKRLQTLKAQWQAWSDTEPECQEVPSQPYLGP